MSKLDHPKPAVLAIILGTAFLLIYRAAEHFLPLHVDNPVTQKLVVEDAIGAAIVFLGSSIEWAGYWSISARRKGVAGGPGTRLRLGLRSAATLVLVLGTASSVGLFLDIYSVYRGGLGNRFGSSPVLLVGLFTAISFFWSARLWLLRRLLVGWYGIGRSVHLDRILFATAWLGSLVPVFWLFFVVPLIPIHYSPGGYTTPPRWLFLLSRLCGHGVLVLESAVGVSLIICLFGCLRLVNVKPEYNLGPPS